MYLSIDAVTDVIMVDLFAKDPKTAVFINIFLCQYSAISCFSICSRIQDYHSNFFVIKILCLL
jgi:hypothetical protein